MAIAITLRVTPEELKAQSNKVTDDISSIRDDIQKMRNAVENSRGYWKGDASDKQYNNFTAGYQTVDQMMTRLDTYPTRLLQMAGIYEVTEEANETTASAMTPDIQIMY